MRLASNLGIIKMITESVSNSVLFSLQSADMSPASSTASLPVSPLAEEPLPFKVKRQTRIIIYNILG